MSSTPGYVEKSIDFLTKTITLTSKIGLIIGGGCIIFYSLINGHYPQGVSIGDGLLFLITALCFGFVYLVFTASLTATGILFSPILKMLLKLGLRLSKSQKNKSLKPALKLEPITFFSGFLGLFGIFFIIILGHKSPIEHAPLALLPLALYMVYSGYTDTTNKIKKLERSAKTFTLAGQNFNNELDGLKQQRLIIGALLIAIPLIVGGVTTDLLKKSMQLAKIRIENATIYVKSPFSNILPNPLDSKLSDFKKFEHVTITFRGVGSTTLVEASDEDTYIKLEIPNDSIIIEAKVTKKHR